METLNEIMPYEQRLAHLKQRSATVPTIEQFALLEHRVAELELFVFSLEKKLKRWGTATGLK